METEEIVARAADLVTEHYVFPDVGGRIAAVLRAGHYAETTPAELAETVTADLRSVNGDPHLRLKYHEDELPDGPDEAAQVALVIEQAVSTLNGVARVDRLDGAVALLALAPALLPPTLAGDTVTAALHVVAPAAALLLDLRDNHGGDPRMVALVCGHLLDEPTHLVTIVQRDPADTRQSWSPAYVPGPRFGGHKPLFVLTGPQTFSGAEELAYDLQALGRATVVGERTRGGAHPRRGYRVHPHLELSVPVARSVSAVTGTNWEGTGVTPDVEVPAADALATAHRLALAALQ